jgi:hypothetical protein
MAMRLARRVTGPAFGFGGGYAYHYVSQQEESPQQLSFVFAAELLADVSGRQATKDFVAAEDAVKMGRWLARNAELSGVGSQRLHDVLLPMYLKYVSQGVEAAVAAADDAVTALGVEAGKTGEVPPAMAVVSSLEDFMGAVSERPAERSEDLVLPWTALLMHTAVWSATLDARSKVTERLAEGAGVPPADRALELPSSTGWNAESQALLEDRIGKLLMCGQAFPNSYVLPEIAGLVGPAEHKGALAVPSRLQALHTTVSVTCTSPRFTKGLKDVFALPPPPDSAWFVMQNTWGKSWLVTFAEGLVLVSLFALPAWGCFTDAGYSAVGYKVLTSDKRDALTASVKDYLTPLKAAVKVDMLKVKLEPVVLKLEKLHLRDLWLRCKIGLQDASTKLHLEAIPKKMQLSPELLDALAAKKDLCRANFSAILAYLRKERPPTPPGPNEWVAVPSAPPKFEGS